MSLEMAKDYYDILGVPRTATREEIKKAYKKLAKQYHPDLNKEPGAADKFKEINEAAAVLGDETKRKQYDQFGTADFQGFQGGEGGFDFSNFSDMFDFGDVFESFFGFGGGRRRAARGSDLRYNLSIDLEEAHNGIEKNILVPRYETCDSCKGNGSADGDAIETCNECNGRGMSTHTRRTPFGMFQTTSPCRSCGGRGKVIKEVCEFCDGEGRIQAKRKLKIDVPEGVLDGTTLRVAGEGEAGPQGGPSGDLYVVIRILEHKIFDRKGDDLYLQVPISFIGAVLGDEIEVPLISGKHAKLKIPAGTQSNTLFKMSGKGMPHLNSSRVGDQFVKVVVHTPESLNKKQKEALHKFAKEMGDKITPQKGFFDRIKEQFS